MVYLKESLLLMGKLERVANEVTAAMFLSILYLVYNPREIVFSCHSLKLVTTENCFIQDINMI